MGIVRTARMSNHMLNMQNTTNATIHNKRGFPDVNLILPRQNVNEHSHSPANNNIIQFISMNFNGLLLAEGCRQPILPGVSFLKNLWQKYKKTAYHQKDSAQSDDCTLLLIFILGLT